ncbi:MAG: DUF3870 domain-containing protein [Thermoanaerobacteraceae bacterium]|nr:DUF3870 domain-containing protein [Thermoanaerobacteraceae bacterium]
MNGTWLRRVTQEKEDDTLLITGYAKLPSTITAGKLHEVVGVAVEVRPEDGEIIDVDCSLATTVARRVVKEIAMGYELSDGIGGLIEEIERRYCGSAHKAVILHFVLSTINIGPIERAGRYNKSKKEVSTEGRAILFASE